MKYMNEYDSKINSHIIEINESLYEERMLKIIEKEQQRSIWSKNST